jgi:DNA mismatch repair ATPase MutS
LTYFKVENKIKTDFEAITFLILELLKISILIEPILVFSALNKLNLKRNEIKVIFDYIGKIDSAISIAILRKETKNYCIPIFSKNKIELDFLSAYHPLIPDCISNSLTINKKSILLTGSNMSGKTSFIKMILINTLLAETINTCFAKYFKLSKMHLFSSIQNSDDLMSNVSSFLNEVHTVKQMINISNTTSTNLLCFDEIFRGTNTIERVAAGKAVLSFLCKFRNIVIVSTHDIDLTKLLEDTYELYHFSEQINNNEVYFDYKLKIGSLTNTNAIKLLELNDFPQMITDEAKSIATILLEKYLQIL